MIATALARINRFAEANPTWSRFRFLAILRERVLANPKSRFRIKNRCSTFARTDALRDSTCRSGPGIVFNTPFAGSDPELDLR